VAATFTEPSRNRGERANEPEAARERATRPPVTVSRGLLEGGSHRDEIVPGRTEASRHAPAHGFGRGEDGVAAPTGGSHRDGIVTERSRQRAGDPDRAEWPRDQRDAGACDSLSTVAATVTEP